MTTTTTTRWHAAWCENYPEVDIPCRGPIRELGVSGLAVWREQDGYGPVSVRLCLDPDDEGAEDGTYLTLTPAAALLLARALTITVDEVLSK